LRQVGIPVLLTSLRVNPVHELLAVVQIIDPKKE
jgi:hypothetical protein